MIRPPESWRTCVDRLIPEFTVPLTTEESWAADADERVLDREISAPSQDFPIVTKLVMVGGIFASPLP